MEVRKEGTETLNKYSFCQKSSRRGGWGRWRSSLRIRSYSGLLRVDRWFWRFWISKRGLPSCFSYSSICWRSYFFCFYSKWGFKGSAYYYSWSYCCWRPRSLKFFLCFPLAHFLLPFPVFCSLSAALFVDWGQMFYKAQSLDVNGSIYYAVGFWNKKFGKQD